MLPIILMHGALGSSGQLYPLQKELSVDRPVHIVEFSGHGNTAYQSPITIEDFAEEVIAYLAWAQLSKADLFGYSMGGYVALYLARYHPEKVGMIVTLGTKLRWDEETAGREIANLDPQKIRQKVPAYAAQLEDRHNAMHWTSLMKQTAGMMEGMGKKPPLNADDYRLIKTPVKLMVGDSDSMVTKEETRETSKLIAGSRIAVLPDTKHPIEKVDIKMLKEEITSFFTIPA